MCNIHVHVHNFTLPNLMCFSGSLFSDIVWLILAPVGYSISFFLLMPKFPVYRLVRLTTTYKFPFEGLATFITCQSFQKNLVLELFNLNLETEDKVMPSSHLPRTPCDIFVYDFPCDFLGIVGGYGLRHICVHIVYEYRAISSTGPRGHTRGKSVQRLREDCAGIVQCQCSCRAVSAASARKSYGARAEIGLRTGTVRDCAMPPTTCLRATVLRIFLFVKLLAKPNRRGRGARESEQKSHSRLLPPQGGLAESARKGGYGQDTGSVDRSQAKCELGIYNS